jgi:hypothetical protein
LFAHRFACTTRTSRPTDDDGLISYGKNCAGSTHHHPTLAERAVGLTRKNALRLI